MSAINYKEITVAQLQQAQSEITAALKNARQNEISAARLKIQAIAESVGIPMKELLTMPVKAKAPATRAPVKFRNPDNSAQEWTGRGRKPRWVQAYVDSGRQLNDLSARH